MYQNPKCRKCGEPKSFHSIRGVCPNHSGDTFEAITDTKVVQERGWKSDGLLHPYLPSEPKS